MQRRLLGVETTEVEAHMASYYLFATNQNGRLPTGSTISITTVRVKRSRVRTVKGCHEKIDPGPKPVRGTTFGSQNQSPPGPEIDTNSGPPVPKVVLLV